MTKGKRVIHRATQRRLEVFSGLALLIGLSAGTSEAQLFLPAGEEWTVNSWTFGRQTAPDVSMAANGDFIVVWQDGSLELGLDGQDGSDGGIRARRFDSWGSGIGSEFQVNISTVGNQFLPFVRHDASGNVLMIWGDVVANQSVGRSFDSSFTPLGGDFPIAPGPFFGVGDVEFQPNGDFVAVWGGGGAYVDLMARRFELDGTPVGAEFQVNTYTDNTQRDPDVAVNSNGDFVVIWSSDARQSLRYDIKAQRFDNTGSRVGEEFMVNTYSTFRQWDPDVAMDEQDRFLVTWFSQKSNPPEDLSPSAIQAQRFDADGNTIGTEFQVNTTTQAVEDAPRIAFHSDGSFMIVWETSKTPGDEDGWGAIAAQQFDADANPVGSEFAVNTYTLQTQDQPSIATNGSGSFVVTWSDSGYVGSGLAEQDGSLNGVFAQRFENPIFADGFESGDTSAWSSLSP